MSSKPSDKWLGFRQSEAGETIAMFALPSGRIREIPVSRMELIQAIADAARALRLSEPEQS